MMVLKHGTRIITESMETHGCVPKAMSFVSWMRAEGEVSLWYRGSSKPHHEVIFLFTAGCSALWKFFTEVIKGKLLPHITSHFIAYSAAAISFQIKYKKIPLKPLTIYNWKKKQSQKKRFKSYVTMLVYSLVDKIKALHIHSLSNACLHFSSFSSFAAFLYLHQWTR